jgi:hypothetical protein
VNRVTLIRVHIPMNTDQSSASETASAAEPVPATQPTLSPLTRNLLFGLSLPERFVRSAVGLTAGTVRELAGFVVPQAFQSSKSYEIAITNSLAFLTETVGGAEGAKASTPVDEAGEFVARKAVGNFIDLAGLATLHVSPMWVLAVISDVCYGTRTYAQEVARELQAQGVIDDSSTIHRVEDILDAIQRASGSAAGAFDRPPLSIVQLRQTISETRAALSQADVRKLVPQSELAGYWSEMQKVAREENASLLEVSVGSHAEHSRAGQDGFAGGIDGRAGGRRPVAEKRVSSLPEFAHTDSGTRLVPVGARVVPALRGCGVAELFHGAEIMDRDASGSGNHRPWHGAAVGSVRSTASDGSAPCTRQMTGHSAGNHRFGAHRISIDVSSLE